LRPDEAGVVAFGESGVVRREQGGGSVDVERGEGRDEGDGPAAQAFCDHDSHRASGNPGIPAGHRADAVRRLVAQDSHGHLGHYTSCEKERDLQLAAVV
jgi:hypothetical protein